MISISPAQDEEGGTLAPVSEESGRYTILSSNCLYYECPLFSNFSQRLRLTGRPDRIVEGNIPEEWKSGNRVYGSHKAQMGVYFLLIEEETGVRPPHGFIVLGDGARVKVENTPEIREWVLGIAEQIRAADLEMEIPVRQLPGKCWSCGVREACGQRAG